MPGQLSVEIVADNQNLLRGLQQTDAAVTKLGTDASKSFNSAARAADNLNKQVTAVGKGADRSMRAVQGASANMAAQFQDIAVQAQSGTASMTIALQQGTQLASVMQGLATSGGGIRALGAALLSVVNPISLITIGLVYLGAELAKFLFGAKQVEALSMDEVLKNTGQIIGEIGDKLPHATQGLTDYQKASTAMLRGEALINARDLTNQLADATDKLVQAWFNIDVTQLDFSGANYQPAITAFQTLVATAETGKPAFDAFFATLDQIIAKEGAWDDGTAAAAVTMGQLVTELKKVNSESPALNAAMLAFFGSVVDGKPNVEALAGSLDKIAQNDADEKTRNLAAEMAAAVRDASTLQGALDAMNQVLANTAGNADAAAAGLSNMARAAKAASIAANQALNDYQGAMAGLVAAGEPVRNAFQQIEDDYKKASNAAKDRAQSDAAWLARTKAIANLEQQGPPVFRNSGSDKPKKTTGGGGGGAAKIPGTDMTEAQLKNWGTAMQQTLNPALKLEEQVTLLDAAIAAGAFPAEQRAAAMKKLEEQFGSTAKKAFDLQKTMEQMMTQWGDNVASSLADAIVNGKDLGQVFQDLIKQLIQMALEMLVLKPLMQSIGAAFGGLGGGATAGWGVPLPFGASPSARSYPAPGMLGARNATNSGGGNNSVTSNVGGITINFGGGGPQAAGENQKAQKFAQRIRDVVQKEIVQQSRPGGLLWGVR